MRRFDYHVPADATHAEEIVSGDREAHYLAGGTNLVDLMKLGVERPARLVDVSHVLGAGIEETEDGGLHIAAGARNSDVAADRRLRARYPMVAQALLAGASGQLRNMATVGGNLLQRTRCLYFQDVSKPCNKRVSGSGCPAREGEHRGLAILGSSATCVATHPSDFAVALAACDAVVHTSRRTLTLTDLYRLPGDNPGRDTILAAGELITGLTLPAPLRRSRYRKVRDRASYSFALVSIAVALEIAPECDGSVLRDVRIALGGVAHQPWRATAAEIRLRGGPLTEAALHEAAAAELDAAVPLRDNAFKVTLAHNLIVATVGELAAS